jgi:hypothetical protein
MERNYVLFVGKLKTVMTSEFSSKVINILCFIFYDTILNSIIGNILNVCKRLIEV